MGGCQIITVHRLLGGVTSSSLAEWMYNTFGGTGVECGSYSMQTPRAARTRERTKQTKNRRQNLSRVTSASVFALLRDSQPCHPRPPPPKRGHRCSPRGTPKHLSNQRARYSYHPSSILPCFPLALSLFLQPSFHYASLDGHRRRSSARAEHWSGHGCGTANRNETSCFSGKGG